MNFDLEYAPIAGNCKWDVPNDVIALSVADMDFKSPTVVSEALMERAASGLFGYQVLTPRDYDAIINWRKSRHGEQLSREWLLATPGVLNTMRAAIYTLTSPGDAVIVQTPLHTPSITSSTMRTRVSVDVPMLCKDGRYTMDYDGLERAFRAGAKVLTLCSPSNPTGRVWTYDELERLCHLVCKYDAFVISDEIHADIIHGDNRFIPIHSFSGMDQRAISVFSPSKTFNFGGFHIATAVLKNAQLKAKLSACMYEAGICCGRPDIMSITAQTAAYENGGAWLDSLLEYLDGNISYAMDALSTTPFKICRPEASILLWIDCSAMNWSTAEYNAVMSRAKILPDPGHYYFMDNSKIDTFTGKQTHFRINIATPRSRLEDAITRLKNAL